MRSAVLPFTAWYVHNFHANFPFRLYFTFFNLMWKSSVASYWYPWEEVMPCKHFRSGGCYVSKLSQIKVNISSSPACISDGLLIWLQQEGSLCAQHCLNALLQGEYFTAVDLATLAQQLDDEERARMAEGDPDSEDYRAFLQVKIIFFSSHEQFHFPSQSTVALNMGLGGYKPLTFLSVTTVRFDRFT